MKRLIFIALVVIFVSSSSHLVAGAETYNDSFDGTGNITWQVRDGTFTVENGRYRAESLLGSTYYAISTAGLSLKEGNIHAKIQSTYLSGRLQNALLIFGYQDNSNYYILGARVGADKWSLEKMENGTRTIILQTPDNLSSGVDYTIKATLQKGDIILYANDVQKLTYSLGMLPEGDVGLAVHNGVAYFDDVMIEIPVSIPRIIRFQGTLGDTQGIPLNGAFTLTFRLYDKDIGAAPLWEEVQGGINIENGNLDVKLGSVTELNLPFDKEYWLGVEVGTDGEMSPRFELTTVPYAFRTEK